MAEGASKYLLLCLLSVLTICSSGEKKFHSSNTQLQDNFHYTTIRRDTIYPPPTIPGTPTIVTVPATIPVTLTPNPTSSTPVTIPSATPVLTPSTNPGNSAVPTTNPVTTPSTVPGAQPVTNPVTTYPTPSPGVPVTNPVAPPATTGSPAVPGQSWCVAKSGAPESAIQAALDYACGIGGADCSAIQQGASCYNPITLQNHASYAFNSYYQKNPAQTSCDFGGTAMITNINPSTGTCVYPSSSSPSSSPMTTSPTPPAVMSPTPPTPTTTTPTPTLTPPTAMTPTPTTPTPTTAANPPPTPTSSSGGTVPSSSSPPTVLNTSYPALGSPTVIGQSPPTPGVDSTTSMATGLQPFISCIIVVTSIVTGGFILEM